MNTNISTIIVAAICGLLLTVSHGFSQGALTPPGAPAPTMKTLDQVEARTIVNAANTPGDANDLFILSQSGSYYLTTNLIGVSGKNGIEITTNNVTLDLNGFAVQGVSGSANGILIPSASTNITIRNGAVSGWGADGVSYVSSLAANVACERLNVSSSGGYGIYLDGSGVVRDCYSQNNNIGINCPGSGGVLIFGCAASANRLYGINVGTNCIVKDCNSTDNHIGIVAANNCNFIGCMVNDNAYAGIEVDNNTNFGIYPISANVTNCITRNSSPGAGYGNVSGNNDYAPIQTPSTATSPWANF